MYTYPEIFKNINSLKDSHSKSKELEKLLLIEPNYDYLEKIISLSKHRTKSIKWSALELLRNFKSNQIEDFIIDLMEKEKDNLTLTYAFEVLSLNGSDKSIPFLIKLFKKSRDSNLRPRLLKTLREIYFRNKLSKESEDSIYSLIGNKYPFFYGFWYNVKKAIKTDITKWISLAKKQLENKKLNLIFELNDKVDIYINFEFIIAIYKKPKYFVSINSISEEFTPMIKTFNNSGSLYGKSIDEILSIIANNVKKLENQIDILESFETMPFDNFFKNRNEIYSILWNTEEDFIVTIMMWKNSFLFTKNKEKAKYIDYINELLLKRQNKLSFKTTEFLNYIKNYG